MNQAPIDSKNHQKENDGLPSIRATGVHRETDQMGCFSGFSALASNSPLGPLNPSLRVAWMPKLAWPGAGFKMSVFLESETSPTALPCSCQGTEEKVGMGLRLKVDSRTWTVSVESPENWGVWLLNAANVESSRLGQLNLSVLAWRGEMQMCFPTLRPRPPVPTSLFGKMFSFKINGSQTRKVAESSSPEKSTRAFFPVRICFGTTWTGVETASFWTTTFGPLGRGDLTLLVANLPPRWNQTFSWEGVSNGYVLLGLLFKAKRRMCESTGPQ